MKFSILFGCLMLLCPNNCAELCSQAWYQAMALNVGKLILVPTHRKFLGNNWYIVGVHAWSLDEQDWVQFLDLSSHESCAFIEPGCTGRFMLTASRDGVCKLWNTAGGSAACLYTLIPHRGSYICSATFSVDDAVFLTLADWSNNFPPDKEARLWCSSSGALLHSFPQQGDLLSREALFAIGVNSILLVHRYSRNHGVVGRVVATMWNIATGDVMKTFVNVSAETGQRVRDDWFDFVLSPRSADHVLATTEKCEECTVWSRFTGQILHRFSHPDRVPLEDSIFSPDGLYVLISTDDCSIMRIAVLTGNVVQVLTSRHGVSHMSYAPNGDFLVTVGLDGQAELWDVHAGIVTNHFSHTWRLAEPWSDSWPSPHSSPFICNGRFLWLVYMGDNYESVISKLFDLETGEGVRDNVFSFKTFCVPLMIPDYRRIELVA